MLLGKSNHGQNIQNLLPALFRCADVLDDHGLFQQLTDPTSGIQRGQGILEHHLQIGPEGTELGIAEFGQIFTLVKDLTAVRLHKA